MEPNESPLWLAVGGPCNSRCDGCDAGATPPLSPDQVRAAAEAARPAVVVLTGPGEPTLSPDLERLVHAARQGGAARVALITNGRLLAYPRVAAAVAGLGLDAVSITLLSADPAVHDRRARVDGAFAQALTGARNLARAGGVRWRLARLGAGTAPPEMARLARIAEQAGLQGVWVDDEGVADAGVGVAPILDRRDFVRQLAGTLPPRRSRDGAVPLREHPAEGAVSLVIRTGCRNACVFCTTRLIQETNRAPWPLEDLSPFAGPLAGARERGFHALRMVAVEPLEHPDVVGFVADARALGYDRIEAWTSARALADPGLADRLAAAGLTDVDVPLFGGSAPVHDRVAGVDGSFDETLAGLRNARGRLRVRHHLVVVRQNLGDLAGMLDLAGGLGLGEPASVLIPGPSLPDDAHYREFAFSHSDGAAAFRALDPGGRRVLASRGFLAQLPPCVLDPREIAAAGAVQPAGIRDGKLEEPGAAAKLRVPCSLAGGCGWATRCPGHHRAYEVVFGVEGLEPGGGAT